MNHVSRRNRNNGLADAVDRFPLFGKTQFLIANVKTQPSNENALL